MAAKDPVVRSLAAKIAANTRWARETDSAKALAPARDARLRQFEALADPNGLLKPAERRRKALLLRRAHMQALALKSKAARAAA